MVETGAADEQKAETRRRLLEWGFWPLLVSLAWGLDTLIKYQARERTGYGLDNFRLFNEQLTSGFAILLMIPLAIAWYRRFPLTESRWKSAIPMHLLGSFLFTLGHFCLLLIFRNLVYYLDDRIYHWRVGFFSNLLFEYQKDIGIYAILLLILWAYQRYRSPPVRMVKAWAEGRLLVQTGRGETTLALADIDYMESARNYVTVYAHGREYLLRETLSTMEKRLAEHPFARTHRSFLVNLERIAEIVPRDTGGHRIVLHNGGDVPLSRGYRDAVRHLLEAPRC